MVAFGEVPLSLLCKSSSVNFYLKTRTENKKTPPIGSCKLQQYQGWKGQTSASSTQSHPIRICLNNSIELDVRTKQKWREKTLGHCMTQRPNQSQFYKKLGHSGASPLKSACWKASTWGPGLSVVKRTERTILALTALLKLHRQAPECISLGVCVCVGGRGGGGFATFGAKSWQGRAQDSRESIKPQSTSSPANQSSWIPRVQQSLWESLSGHSGCYKKCLALCLESGPKGRADTYL